MGLIEFKPLGDVEKYLQLGVVACVSFFGTIGSVGGAMLAGGSSPLFACATGFFSACLVMAAALLNAARKVGIKAPLPKGLEQVVANTDLQATNPDVKRWTE